MPRVLMIEPPRNRPRWARLPAAGAAGAVMAAAALWVDSHDRPRPPPTPAVGGVTSADTLAADLARCQALGEAGARDTGCLQIWTQARRRFLATGDRHVAAPGSTSNGAQDSTGGD